MYWILEEGDEAMGFTWDLLTEENGVMVRVGSFYGEAMAKKMLTAIMWYETNLEDGRLSIPQKQKPVAKKKPQAIDIIFTPAKKKGGKK